MKTLREQLKDLQKKKLKDATVHDWCDTVIAAKQMDALLEECYQALQCPIKSQVMVELLKNNGYGQ